VSCGDVATLSTPRGPGLPDVGQTDASQDPLAATSVELEPMWTEGGLSSPGRADTATRRKADAAAAEIDFRGRSAPRGYRGRSSARSLGMRLAGEEFKEGASREIRGQPPKSSSTESARLGRLLAGDGREPLRRDGGAG